MGGNQLAQRAVRDVVREDERLQRRAQVVAHRACEGVQHARARRLLVEQLTQLAPEVRVGARGGTLHEHDRREHLGVEISEGEQQRLGDLGDVTKLHEEPDRREGRPGGDGESTERRPRGARRDLLEDELAHAAQRYTHGSARDHQPSATPEVEEGGHGHRVVGDRRRQRRRPHRCEHAAEHDRDHEAGEAQVRLARGQL
mmetsp:Transcript_1469/g.3631  ORF Transcript_1469/g.3631 Transcript_1469/m.3631 type:complete len:200 (-) Transcript_1469:666-1265(-)